MRDLTLEDTAYFDFTTRAFATGIPTVLAGTPVLSVLEENNATPITAGVSVSVDRASVVGLNMATIVATAANGYENGKGYSIYISTGTVGGVSVVGEKVGEFTIGASAAAVDLANGTDGLGEIKGDTAAVLVDTGTTLPALLPATLVGGRIDATVDATGFEQGAIDNVWDELLTGSSHNIATSAGRRLRQVEQAFTHANGTIATVTNGHTFTLDAGAVATADYYIGDRLQITEGTGAGQSRLIVAYSAGRVAILDSDFTTNPDTSSLYEIIAADVHVSLSDADLASGFVAVYTNTTTITLDATNAVATADYYVGEQIVFTHGAGAGQAREITAYTSGRVVTMSPALEVALDTTTVWHIQAVVSIPEMVDEMLDEALSDHQTQGTTGAAITMAAYLGPRGPGVYIDDAAANTGTTLGDDGTLENPVSTIAAAKTIADSLSVDRIYLVNDSGITLAATMEYEFVGIGEMSANSINFGSQDVDNSTFHNLLLTGAQGGTGRCQAEDCVLSVITGMEITALRCLLANAGSLTLRDDCAFDSCFSAVAGAATPTLDINSVASVNVYFRHYSGGMTIDNAVATTVMSYEADGQLIIDATCTSLTIVVRGNCSITDNGTTTSLTQDAAVNRTNINAEVADVLKTDTLTATPQAAPPTTPTFEEAVALLYDALIHKVDVTATLKEFHNNAGTVIWKKALSDDGTTYTEAESAAGP